MFRIVNDYVARVNIGLSTDIELRIDDFCRAREDISRYCINVSFNRYVVDMRLKDFSVDDADDLFRSFSREISYSYSSIFVRYNEGDLVRYKFVTSKEDKSAVYIDIVIAG